MSPDWIRRLIGWPAAAAEAQTDALVAAARASGFEKCDDVSDILFEIWNPIGPVLRDEYVGLAADVRAALNRGADGPALEQQLHRYAVEKIRLEDDPAARGEAVAALLTLRAGMPSLTPPLP